MNSRSSGFQQAVTGFIVAGGIIATVTCGIFLARADQQRRDPVAALPTSTLFQISTLPNLGESTATRRPTINAPTVIVIPTQSVLTVTPTPPPGSPRPSDTATPTQTPKVTGTPPPMTNCTISSSWTVYRIQPGDTLFNIGLRYGLRVDSLMRGNCLTDDKIVSGGTLYVPPVTPFPISTWQAIQTNDPPGSWPPPASTGTQTATDGACTNASSVITSPRVAQVMTGKFAISGTASMPNFAYYKLEVRQEGTPMSYANVFTGTQEVTSGTLTVLDTAVFPNGEYWLRLVVVDQDGNYPERCAMLVVFMN